MTVVEIRQRCPGWEISKEIVDEKPVYRAVLSSCFGSIDVDSNDPDKVIIAVHALEIALTCGAVIFADFVKR